MGKFHDITGLKFGRLTAMTFVGSRGGFTYWACVCECGNTKEVRANNLKTGRVRSCGCLFKEGNHTTHKMRDFPEYPVWASMVKRCSNPKEPAYRDYGARGITVSDQWLHFENFIADMGRRPSKEHTLERLDNRSGYAPENCVWATRMEQARNKRNNLNIEMNGRTQCLAAWCEELDLYYDTVHARLYASGWSPEKALMTPTRLGYIPYSSR